MPNRTSVLIVDDDTGLSGELSEALKSSGYVVTVVDNGQHAVDLSKKRPFDVILMDVKMPVMGGVEAYKKIKQIRPSAAILFMTGYALGDMAKDMVGEGEYEVINKPYTADIVVGLIEKSQKGFLVSLVDPDIDLRNKMRYALQHIGYRVAVCKSGEEAIALARQKAQDIFFIDTELPALNVFVTYLEIKKINPKATVVMMTAYRQKTEEIVKQTIEKGAYSCLYKPFAIETAVRVIEEIAKKKSGVKS